MKENSKKKNNLEVDVGRAGVEPDAHILELLFQQRPATKNKSTLRKKVEMWVLNKEMRSHF